VVHPACMHCSCADGRDVQQCLGIDGQGNYRRNRSAPGQFAGYRQRRRAGGFNRRRRRGRHHLHKPLGYDAPVVVRNGCRWQLVGQCGFGNNYRDKEYIMHRIRITAELIPESEGVIQYTARNLTSIPRRNAGRMPAKSERSGRTPSRGIRRACRRSSNHSPRDRGSSRCLN